MWRQQACHQLVLNLVLRYAVFRMRRLLQLSQRILLRLLQWIDTFSCLFSYKKSRPAQRDPAPLRNIHYTSKLPGNEVSISIIHNWLKFPLNRWQSAFALLTDCNMNPLIQSTKVLYDRSLMQMQANRRARFRGPHRIQHDNHNFQRTTKTQSGHTCRLIPFPGSL
jgi:hypothetical protein